MIKTEDQNRGQSRGPRQGAKMRIKTEDQDRGTKQRVRI